MDFKLGELYYDLHTKKFYRCGRLPDTLNYYVSWNNPRDDSFIGFSTRHASTFILLKGMTSVERRLHGVPDDFC